MGSIANARLRSLSARSAARRCAFLLFGLAALAGTASRASAAVDERVRAAPSIGRLVAEDAGSRATRRARRLRGKRRQYGRSSYRHLAAGTPDHVLAMRHAVAYAAAGEAAQQWRPHAVHPHRKARRPGTMLASLGHELVLPTPQEQPSLSGVPIRWGASSDCLAMPLRAVLVGLAQAFGQLQVNSTCRSPRHNARVGGAKHSFHLTGHAADFRVSSNPSAVLAFLRARGDVGGLKHYGSGLFHIDTGPRRTW
jgi:Peptidase M15